MKKHLALPLLILALSLLWLLPQTACAYMLYQNPGRIILTAPTNGLSTTSARISLLGACDWTKPLYLNGKPLAYTEHGFFAAYVDLQPGQNTFTLKQGDNTKTVTVTRKSAGSKAPAEGFSWDKLNRYSAPIWGEVKADNITHRRLPDSSQHLLNALAKGTICRIIGDYGNYYCLADNTFVLKSSLRQIAAPPPAEISSITITPRTAQNCTELNLNIGRSVLYQVSLGDNEITVTLTGEKIACPRQPVYTDNPMFSEIRLSNGGKNDTLVITLPLKQGIRAFGYYAEQRGEYMVFGFKLPPQISVGTLTAPDLTGATVLLDAGHGGTDSGALGAPGSAGPTEKNINLVIANYAKKRLEQLGATVIVTRADDATVSLSGRVAQILAAKPDLSISLHSNSIDATADYTKTKGFRAYYTFDTAADACRQISAGVSRLAGVNETLPTVSNLALTRIESCPALLLENAFMSNPADYELMIQSEYQQRFGEAVADAAAAWLCQNADASAAGYPITEMSQAVLSDSANRPISVFLDGQQLTFDVAPTLKNDATLVPLRVIFEALAAQVNWDAAAQSVTAVRGDLTLRMTLNRNELVIRQKDSERTVELIAPAISVNQRILVPLRAVSEGFGCTVEWEAAERAVVIRTIED